MREAGLFRVPLDHQRPEETREQVARTARRTAELIGLDRELGGQPALNAYSGLFS